ncbi:MAG: DUF3105 domain-containing protein [Actinomycetota bacterium]|nr:DUF3105 domain-containing protein [Actinomycetota bacterium]
MASRTKQKEEARARRLAEEQARAERARRTRRLRMAGGLVLGLVAVIAVAVAIASGGGKKTAVGAQVTPAPGAVKLPTPKITNLAAAVKAAGCVQIATPDAIARTSQNRTHVSPGTKVPYATNPPTYGPHYPAPASDGEYRAGATPATGYLVHALEHGRIEYQYRPGTPANEVKQLEALFTETDGQWAPKQMLLLLQNQTGMPYAVAATAWGQVLGCKTFSPRIFDALRDFRLQYTNQGPEQLGTGPE